MQKMTNHLLLAVLIILLFPKFGQATGTALMLGAGQELRIDLPLEANKTYAISMDLRTDLPQSVVNMTLCLISNNNEVLEYQILTTELGDGGRWTTIGFPEVQIPHRVGRWEMVITADTEGRYYWKDLKVYRTYGSSLDTQAYWSEKLAEQGTFYTGLVIDARHLDVRRGISPRIYSESGQLIYGGVLASQELVQERGVVGYGSELTPELLTRLEVDPDYPYIAPLLVEAIAVTDAAQTGVIISEADTQRILEAMAKYDFLARYAVIFLVN
ncbi:MAG: hypothetical protein GX971_08695 [Firmicutes bacterium]|nr:hypothetical protein [Bacillota bacterium]